MRYTTDSTPIVNPEKAAKKIHSGQRVFIHSVAMTPHTLSDALCARSEELREVELVHIHTERDAPYVNPELSASFSHNACFVGSNVRQAVNQGYADYIPVFLSEMPLLFRRGFLPFDVALISVSAPDNYGYCSLGPSVDITLAALESAKLVIAEINSNVPRTHGDGFIHFGEIDYAIQVEHPLPTVSPCPICPIEEKIGKHIAEMIDDGDTLQMGLGSIPDAILAQLGNHKHLGVHTEMFSDGLISLVEKGVITGEKKTILPNVITATFAMGTKKLYDFIHDNRMVMMKDAAFTNDSAIIRQNPKVTAINSAIEIDLTG